jgi:hypothetical protein
MPRAARLAAALLATLLLAGASPGSPPRLFVHLLKNAQRPLPPKIERIITQDPQTCGAQLSLPWAPIDDGSGRYDWSSVERAIAPWTQAGKVVALSFHGVAEKTWADGTGRPATPDYVLHSVDTLQCELKVIDTWPTPVYFEPGYAEPWKRFIAATIRHFENDPRIAYLRFGIGAGDETFPVARIRNDPSCVERWRQRGMSYERWLAWSTGLIDYVASLKPRIGIAFGMNHLGVFDRTAPDGGSAYAEAVAAAAARHGFMIGSEGFGGTEGKWDAIYRRYRGVTPLYAQTASPEKTGRDNVPKVLADARALGIEVLELYAPDWLVAYDPRNADYASLGPAYRSAFQSLGRPASCRMPAP